MAQPTGSKGTPLGPRPAGGPAGSTTPETLQKIGKYEIQKKIGAGGMGAVFLALDPNLKRSVALKVLPKEKAANPTLVKRFKAEAQAAANLRHDNIVMVYEAGEADGYLYIALEYVDGTDVANLVAKRGILPVKRSCEVIRQTALALQHAHEQGIVHRDIKPGNLLIRRDGLVKLADMGLARAVDEQSDTSITRAGTTVGTIDYMAPEQARNSKSADVRSDLYSLGCTWYFMLTGQPPFAEGSMTNKLRAHAESQLPNPQSANPAVTEALVGVMRRMTEKDPARRYQTPAELIADLDAATVAGDMVSEAILEDLEDRPVRRRSEEPQEVVVALDDDDERATGKGKRRKPRPAAAVDDVPDAKRKPAKLVKEREESEWSRAIPFYALVGLIVVAVFVGLGMLVRQYGASVDLPKGAGANPFADAQAAAAAAAKGGTGGQTSVVQGKAGTTGSQSAQGADSNTSRTVKIGNSGDAASTVISGSGLPATTSKVTGGGKALSAAAEARRQKEDAALPDWTERMGTAADVSKLTRLVVRRGAGDSGRFASLNAAFDQVPVGGAQIILEGPGPFPLYPVALVNRGRVVIASEGGPRAAEPPLIVLLPPTEGSASNFIDFVNTSLELRHVHLGLDASGFTTDPNDALIHIQGGNLAVQHCSVSVTGSGTSPMVALKLTSAGAAGEPTRVFIDRTVIRGNGLVSLLVDLPRTQLVVRRSVLWSGLAPAIRLAGAAASDEDRRELRFVSATLCSSWAALQVADDPTHPVATDFDFTNSLASATGAEQKPALCLFDGWSAAQAQGAIGTSITWKSTDSLYLGWKSLVRLEPGAVALAASGAQWLALWKQATAGTTSQFQEAVWPPHPVSDVVAAELNRFEPETVGKQYVKTAEGGWPGCSPDWLELANLSALGGVQGATERPQIPAGMLGGPATAETIRVDLTRDDLGKVLASKKLSSGSVVIATGHGARQSSPIVIENAWIRIRFEQAEGVPLVLSPRPVEATKSAAATGSRDALFVVNHGGLELTGAALTIPISEKQEFPRWLIRAFDSDLVVRQCRLQGPLSGAAPQKGLIQWQRADGQPPPRTFAAAWEACAVIEGSYLYGGGSLIEADLRQRALFIHNTVAVSREDFLKASLRGVESQIDGALDLESTTISATGACFSIEGAQTPAGAPVTAPLAIYADRCVIAPPLRTGSAASPTLLVCDQAGLDARQVKWWENRCGYAPEITCFVRDSGAPVRTQDFETAWRARWGAGVIEPLTGPKGIVLAADLPQRAEDRAKLEPTDLALHTASKGATWDGGERPIGARFDELHVPPIRAVKGAATKPRTTKPAPPAAGQKPAF